MAGLAPQSCIDDIGSLILTQSADAPWKTSSKRRRAWLVISKGKSQTKTCMVPLKAHFTHSFAISSVFLLEPNRSPLERWKPRTPDTWGLKASRQQTQQDTQSSLPPSGNSIVLGWSLDHSVQPRGGSVG